MSPKHAAIIGLCAALIGCTTTSQPSGQEEKIFGRVDCQRMRGNPILENEYAQAGAICLNRAKAAAVSGTTGIAVGYGGGAIASGIQRGMAQREIADSTALSCMAEQGYFYSTLAEHDARCIAIASAGK